MRSQLGLSILYRAQRILLLRLQSNFNVRGLAVISMTRAEHLGLEEPNFARKEIIDGAGLLIRLETMLVETLSLYYY